MRVVPLPTGAGSDGVRSATLDDETTTELRAILRKAAGRIEAEASEAAAKVRARAARIRSRIEGEAMGIEIAIAVLVAESLFSRHALG